MILAKNQTHSFIQYLRVIRVKKNQLALFIYITPVRVPTTKQMAYTRIYVHVAYG